MKIRKLQLKNIGVFDDETIEFKKCEFNKGKEIKDRKAEIHIFTGQNGSGKTTVLEALAESIIGFGNHSKNKPITKKIRNSNISKKEIRVTFDGKNVVSYMEVDNYETQFSKLIEGEYEKNESGLTFYRICYFSPEKFITELDFAAFAYSGYRRIIDEPIEIGQEIHENPLQESVNFIKNEKSKFTINQWLGHNLIDSSLAKSKGKLDEAKEFDKKINILENVINDFITDETKASKIKFQMQSATKLVLIKDNLELDFDVLPDGLKSLISWIGDLLMRLDSLEWEKDTPIFDREILLFLDEIEVHLHPAWQRKVLPVVQKLFKNSQIFVSTHSPFVVNSVDDAWVYKLELKNGKARVAEPIRTENSNSVTQVLREIFDIYGLFGKDVQDNIDELEKLRNKILSNGTNKNDEQEFLRIARKLYDEPSDQVKNIVKGELQQLSEIKGKKFSI
jgi:predicted ATP-binding protein involved in virulence